jgi:hypothetical protein
LNAEIYPRDYEPFIIVNPNESPHIKLLILDRHTGSSITVNTCVAQLENLKVLIDHRLAEIKASPWHQKHNLSKKQLQG